MNVRRTLAIALTASVAFAGLATVTATGASGATPAAKLQPRAVSNTTTWAAVKTVSVPQAATNFPAVDIAVNSADDTVYVVNSDRDNLAVINGRTGALDDSFTVTDVRAVAVDQNDDTIYTATMGASAGLYQVQSRSASSPGAAVTNEFVESAVALAVDSLDDTVYVAQATTPGKITYFSGRTPTNTSNLPVGGRGVYGLAVDQLDDSVWMAYGADDSTRAWNGRTLALGSFVGTGDQPLSVAVNGPDDTVYVADSLPPNNITVINGRTSTLVRTLDGPFAIGTEHGLAVDDSNGLLFTASGGVSSTFGVIKQANLDDSVYVGATFATGIPSPPRASSYYKAVAVDDSGPNHGLVWAYSPSSGNVVQALTQVSPSLTGTTTGAAGARVFVTVTSPSVVAPFVMDTDTVLGVRFNSSSLVTSLTREDDTTWSVALPSGLPAGQVSVEVQFNGYQYARTVTDYMVLASTPAITSVSPTSGPTSGGTSVTITGANLSGATSVTFGGTAGTITANTATSITVTTPAGAAGAANVSVTTAGGTATSAGAFTFISPTPPPPDPSRPPGAPGAVLAQAGDERAMVTWSRPSSEGSSPITNYEAEAFPSGETCTVTAPSTSCTVTGLENGSSYVFRVRARNSVGWSEFSSPSNMVIPKSSASIMITGSRSSSDPQQVRVKGTSTGLGGKDVTPYVRFPGQTSFKAGTGTKKVASDGTFTWQRKTGKRIYVYFQHASIRSNTVNIAPR